MKFEQDILKAQIASQLSQEASIEGTDINILIKSFEENLLGSYDRGMFMKSWSGDLQKKFPSGGWRTINGASVFINGGKVVAGLGGFNGMIDDYFSAKKENESGKSKSEVPKSFEKVFGQIKETGHSVSISSAKMIANNEGFSASEKHRLLDLKLQSAKNYQQGEKEKNKEVDVPKHLTEASKKAWNELESAPKKTEEWKQAKNKWDKIGKEIEEYKTSNQPKEEEKKDDKPKEDGVSIKERLSKEIEDSHKTGKPLSDKFYEELLKLAKEDQKEIMATTTKGKEKAEKDKQMADFQEQQKKIQEERKNAPKKVYGRYGVTEENQPKEEEKKDKPVNERTQQEIHEAKQKIADTMPKPINKMTWEEFKPYGIEMAKQSAHSQPESYYERMAKNEHDWATKNDKSQYDVPEKQKIEKKGGLSSVEQQLFDNAKKRYSGISEQRTIEIRDKIVQADKGKTSNINAFAESLMYSDGENHVEDYFGDAKEEAKMAQRAIDGKSGYENAQRIVDLKIGGNLEAKAKELISQYELIKNKANQLGLESPSKQVLKTALSFSGQEMTLSQVIELLNKVKGGELAEVAEAIRNNFKNDSQTNTVTIDTFKEIAKKAKDPKDFEEKAKLSPRAKQVLKDSQRTFDSSNSLRQIELYDLVKKNIGIDKNGKEKIGMGLDEDMVAAGNEFLKKNEKAYNEAKELIQSRKDFKKEEGKTKATKDVSNIEKIALQQNKEMEDKIKSVSSSASVKEKLEGVKQISNKIDNISKQEIYNSKTNQYNFKLMEDMSDVLKNIDEKYLSKDQKNEIDELKDNLDTMVSVDTLLSAPNQSKKKRRYEYDHFLKEHDSLSEKMEVLTKRLKYESDDKGNYSPQEHGSLSSFEDEVENVQKFLGSIKKDYVSRQATELLNYKLF